MIDGYFANQTLHVTNDTEEAGDYCISRNFYTNNFNSSQPSNIQTCLNYTDFAEMWYVPTEFHAVRTDTLFTDN